MILAYLPILSPYLAASLDPDLTETGVIPAYLLVARPYFLSCLEPALALVTCQESVATSTQCSVKELCRMQGVGLSE